MNDSQPLFKLIHTGRSGQRVYSLKNGLSASVLKSGEVAVLNLHDPNAGLEGGFHINYHTPFGPPHIVNNIESTLNEIANYDKEATRNVRP